MADSERGRATTLSVIYYLLSLVLVLATSMYTLPSTTTYN